jgi:hypothetical protein
MSGLTDRSEPGSWGVLVMGVERACQVQRCGSGSGYVVGLVGDGVETLVFAGGVEGPVGVEVIARGEGSESEDGFGSFEVPAGAGDVESAADEVAAGLRPPGGDRPATFQGGVVAELVEVTGEVADACVHAFAFALGEMFPVGLGGHLGSGSGGLAVQDQGG